MRLIIGYRKHFYKTVKGLKVFTVDGERVRRDHIEFTEGGNGYVYNWIPKSEIWIDENMKSKPRDMKAVILHEAVEVFRMKRKRESYPVAHSRANIIESKFRNQLTGAEAEEFYHFGKYSNLRQPNP